MATKAAERARQWAEKNAPEMSLFVSGLGNRPQQFIKALADYEAATIERCAQIADSYSEFINTLPESSEPIAAFGKDLTKRVAAAIRAMKGEQ